MTHSENAAGLTLQETIRMREQLPHADGQIRGTAAPRHLTPARAAELERISAEIAASERALRDGSVPVGEAALWHADWVAEKILFEAELSRSAPAPERLRRMETHTDSGVYRGLIVGETPRHVVQQLPGRGLVAHRKGDLDRSLRAGETVIVRYSHGRATVYEASSRSKSRNLERER